VVKHSAARKSTAKEAAHRGPDPASIEGAVERTAGLDRVIHERLRLGILSALVVNERLSFTDLKGLLSTTDGNLSVHARKLEDAGYIACQKGFDGRIPRTEFRVTAKGRKALKSYLDHMEALIAATRA
jgi:DNA-binding MarR family transcriptional regulator